jgi:tetratricopeptide (TPR) repeat protein
MFWYESADPSPARRARAKVALDAAVHFAPNQPETRLALGAYAYYCDNDWSRALVEFHAAQASMPNNAQLEYFIALTERRLGHYPEAIRRFNRSLELNPRDFLCVDTLLQSLVPLRRYEVAHDHAARTLPLFPDNANMLAWVAEAQLEHDHDTAAYLRARERLIDNSHPADAAVRRYQIAMLKGDFAAAERALDEPQLKTIGSLLSIINDPVARHRARVAFLRGDRDRARKFAEEAIAYYQTHVWTPRQTGAANLGLALAHSFAGRGDEAIKLAHEAYEWQLTHDVFTSRYFLPVIAEIYFVLDRPEDVLNTLREMMRDAGDGPEHVRLQPAFSKVKNDPRFEEILKLAKPL